MESMDLAAGLVVLAMLILTAAFVARPLVEGGGRAIAESERHLSTLYAERDQILGLLQELEMDFTMGKILPDDYQEQRAERVTRGAEVLKEIDGADDGIQATDREARLEAEVARLRGEGAAASDPAAALEARLESEVARLRRGPQEGAGFCGECGQPLVAGDRFCSRCGTPVPLEGSHA
jgi:hypothetical protein